MNDWRTPAIGWVERTGNIPYPTTRSGLDLRKNGSQLLKNWEASKKARAACGPDDAISALKACAALPF